MELVDRKSRGKARIAVFVSGGGTNLQALIDEEKAGKFPDAEIVLVVSGSRDAYALKRAENAGIETVVCVGKDREADMLKALREHGIDMVVLAGYLKILSSKFIDNVGIPVINIHPALLPKHGGKGCYGLHVHEQVLEAGEKETGATVHYVNEITDGGEIIIQRSVAVEDGDTPEILQRRVMEQAEWKILPEAVRIVSRKILKNK